MRISAKGRYALAAMISMARGGGDKECITVIRISKELGISKIYLEQVFSLLRRAGLVRSVKGAQGGYQLIAPLEGTTALQILSAVELALFEETEETVAENAPDVEAAMKTVLFQPVDAAVREALEKITLQQLADCADAQKGGQGMMFYI